jgi:hypothetical protein
MGYKKIVYEVLVGEPEEQQPLQWSRVRLDDNIKGDLKGMEGRL